MKFIFSLLLLQSTLFAHAQPDRWQQAGDYTMSVAMDVATNRYTGTQVFEYTNNSPDTLRKVFYHLYFNAFQPNSMMDVRSRTIKDPDRRVGSRIAALGPDEIGYLRVEALTQNGQAVQYVEEGTILEVDLAQPILPGSTTTFDMRFAGQVPLQVRRSGRDNAEGVRLTMTQWFPRMAEYDYQGWHANPYVGREFYGVWSDFDVKITIDKSYVVAGTGYLQNPNEIGYGYGNTTMDGPRSNTGSTLTYHFLAPNVIDFAWAADPDYTHLKRERKDGVTLHAFFQPEEGITEGWEQLLPIMDEALDFINEHYGNYPYEQYSFIQGGDGGMEYPMATMITGKRPLGSLVGVSVHELLHSWYQMILGTNESLYPWMDEGFTSFASNEVMNHLKREGLLPGEVAEDPHAGSFGYYARVVEAGLEEPMTTHADHYGTNIAYSMASYGKGALFLQNLRYVIGDPAFDRTMLRYFDTWKFKHPNPNDFVRIAEKESGLELDWYKEYLMHTTEVIDYAVDTVYQSERKETTIGLRRNGRVPMPTEVLVTYKNGDRELFYAPLRILRGEKPHELSADVPRTVLPDWPWTHPTYKFTLPTKLKRVDRVEWDPSGRVSDVNRANNVWVRE